jgi:hypothetical protein
MSLLPYTNGNIPVYRFYLNTFPSSSVIYEVFPLNFLSTSLVDQPEGDQVFYRRKFNGSLLFGTNDKVYDSLGLPHNRSDDFSLLWAVESIDPCEKLYFTITKSYGTTTDIYWEGSFSTSDGEFDIDRCTFEVTPITEDDFTDILELADVEYNILDVATQVSVTAKLIGGGTEVYPDNRWLYKPGSDNVVEFLCDKVKTGVNVSSTFFTADPNPITLATNHLKSLTIAQKSDIIRPASSDPATSAMLSFNGLMEILRAMFNVYWNYDALTDTINIEHISWFTKIAGLDLRNQLSCTATNKYKYLKSEMPKFEKFNFMEADYPDFVGVPIWYDSACVNQDAENNIKEISINVTTDLEYILDNEDAISDEGFVILCTWSNGGTNYVERIQGILGSDDKLNMRLSWSRLQQAYHRHNRILLTGYMNEILNNFCSTIKMKSQDCSAIICPTEDYNSEDEITTELGETYFGGTNASVLKASIRPNNVIDFELGYGLPDVANPGYDDDYFFVTGYIDWVAEDVFNIYFDFSQPAPHDINIRIRNFVYTGAALQCTSGWDNVTFTAGTISETYNGTLCEFLDVGQCFQVEIEYTGADMDGMTITPAAESCTVAVIYTIL